MIEQHPPSLVGELLRLVDDDVRERPRESVALQAGQRDVVVEAVLHIVPAQHRHQPEIVAGGIGKRLGDM